jgi:multidrug efflux pump subunit AcrB
LDGSERLFDTVASVEPAMNVSLPFIERPIATTLLSIGIFLVGAVAYAFLPVAALPSIEYPTIHVSASRPVKKALTMSANIWCVTK